MDLHIYKRNTRIKWQIKEDLIYLNTLKVNFIKTFNKKLATFLDEY